jgi:hypothetical protein
MEPKKRLTVDKGLSNFAAKTAAMHSAQAILDSSKRIE